MNTIPEPTNRTEVYLYNIYKLLLQIVGSKQEVKQEVKQEEVKKTTRKKKTETVE